MVYLDNAATSYPKAPGVASAMADYVEKVGATINRSSYASAQEAGLVTLSLRERLCRLFNHPDPTHAVLTPGATAGLNMVIKGLLRPGDHCLVSSMEHNAVMRPLVQLEREGVAFERIPCDAQGRLTAEALPEVEARLERMSCLAIGPGLGRSAGVTEFVQGALAASRVPTVVDADALWALSRDMSSLEDAACPLVLTPHEGEFAMLGGLLDGDRVASARRFASRWGCTLVLKGSGSVVAFPDGECYVNQTGNPGMARGGSGDVLTGLMAAMLCQLPFRDAVRAAVYLHGLAGDMAAGELGEYGMTPTDMIRLLPAALKTVTEE